MVKNMLKYIDTNWGNQETCLGRILVIGDLEIPTPTRAKRYAEKVINSGNHPYPAPTADVTKTDIPPKAPRAKGYVVEPVEEAAESGTSTSCFVRELGKPLYRAMEENRLGSRMDVSA